MRLPWKRKQPRLGDGLLRVGPLRDPAWDQYIEALTVEAERALVRIDRAARREHRRTRAIGRRRIHRAAVRA